jgi:hypothetical protein
MQDGLEGRAGEYMRPLSLWCGLVPGIVRWNRVLNFEGMHLGS